MARDQNNISEASNWFKSALNVNKDNPEVWLLLGHLHMNKFEWGPAQNKFSRVLSVCILSLYNILIS